MTLAALGFVLGLLPRWGWALLLTAAVATVGVWHAYTVHQARKEGYAAAIARMHERTEQDAKDRNAANERVTDAYIKQRDAIAHAAAGARAESERLREQLAALSPADPASGAGADGGAEHGPWPELLRACVGRYQAVAAEADRLAGQVRGLQNYARSVCLAADPNPTKGSAP